MCGINIDPNTFLNEFMRHSALRKTGAFGNGSRHAFRRTKIRGKIIARRSPIASYTASC
jgi:hypothetical protein